MPKGIYLRTIKSLHWKNKNGPLHPRWKGGRRAAMARYRERTNVLIDELKNRPCADCGEWFHPCQMDYDHRDSSTKIEQVSNLVWGPIKKLFDEIAKCDLVCANCHRLRTLKQSFNKGNLIVRSKKAMEILEGR